MSYVNRELDHLSVIVPFYNEAESLALLHTRLRSELSLLGCDYRIIYVDDGSTDASWDLVHSWAQNEECRGVRLIRNFGKEATIRAGLEEVKKGAAVVMDADLQHPPEVIKELVACWEKGDFWVVEARRKGHSGRHGINALGSYLVYSFMFLVTGIHLGGRSDFCLLDHKVVQLISQLPERVTFFRGVVCWFGFPAGYVFFEVPPRIHGSTKWSLWKLMNQAINMITGFSTFPLNLVTFFSFLFLGFSGLLILQTLYMYLTGQAVEGFTTVIISILIVGSVLAGGMGILGQYLARIYEEVKCRPMYVLREKIGQQGSD